jgi:hypothetical protein
MRLPFIISVFQITIFWVPQLINVAYGVLMVVAVKVIISKLF